MLRRASRLISLVAYSLLISSCFAQAEPATISVYGPYVGVEADLFGEVLRSFEEETGITVNYVGTSDFQDAFADRVGTADLPDVVVLPQPALLPVLIERSIAEPMSDEDGERVLATVGPEWAPVIAPGDQVVAVPYRFVVKSIVWYRADAFANRGYSIPATLDELTALASEIQQDGLTPWCGGMDDSLATGWWGTDWIEDLLLRRSGLEIYGTWAALDTPFTDEAVVSAMTEFQQVLGGPGAVDGGRRAILNTQVSSAMDPMFEDPPGCLMHKQASFQPVWFPSGVEYGDGQVDLFPMPPVEAGPAPMIISGEIAAATSENPAAQELLLYLIGDGAFEPWREIGGSLTPRADPDDEVELGPLDQRLAELLEATEEVAFDASDLMPREVGTGSFFAGMIDLVAGTPPEEVADDIQRSVDSLEAEG